MTAIVTWCRADDGFRTFGAIVFELFEIFCMRHARFRKTGRIYLFIHINSGLKYVECTEIDFLPVKLLSVQFCDHLWTFSQVHSPIRPNGHRVYVTLQGVKWLILWNMGSFHRHFLTDNHTNQILTYPSLTYVWHNSLLTVSHLSAMYELLLETVGNDLQATEVSFHQTPAPFWFHRMQYTTRLYSILWTVLQPTSYLRWQILK